MATVRVYLVRHGRAAAGWDVDPDPDLDEFGWRQAHAVAETLIPLGPCAIVSSPLLRCRSTAIPTATSWGIEPVIDSSVAEIPSPEGVEMAQRVGWLRGAMTGTWADLGPRYTSYRDQVVARVTGCTEDTAIFSHFVAINAVIGACTGDDRLVIRSLDNCSVTVVEVSDVGLGLIEGGHEADTLIR
jgi:broad specificity phosphatase PhoE